MRWVGGVAELREALGDSNVAVIYLAFAYSPYNLEAEIKLERNVTLIGEGITGEGWLPSEGGQPMVKLDALASRLSPRRVLNVAADATVTLQGLTLTGAWMPQGSDPGGGAVSNAGTLSMLGCRLEHNSAYSGAAICSACRACP